jgi:hypothetical protein
VAAAGTDARSFSLRGVYNPDVIYDECDVVMLGGSSFVAKRSNPGNCPGTNWTLLAGVGRRGAKGERGERGAPGATGAPGKPGQPGPMIVEWRIIPDTYTVVAVFDDDRVSSPLDLRPLFERYNAERVG